MAENPGKSLLTAEECSQCGLKPAVFLLHVWLKGEYLHICTACVLNLHRGAYCPVCFEVYDDQNNPPIECIKCGCCEALYHGACIPWISSLFSKLQAASASSSSSSSSSWSKFLQGSNVICPFCCDPNREFFDFSRDERTNAVIINKSLASQMLAAAIISNRSVKKAAEMASVRAQLLCKEAVDARKKAKEALQKLHDLTFSPQVVDTNYEEEASNDDDDASDDDDDDDASDDDDDDDASGDDDDDDDDASDDVGDEAFDDDDDEAFDNDDGEASDDVDDDEYVFNVDHEEDEASDGKNM